jgi:hypothetical protein
VTGVNTFSGSVVEELQAEEASSFTSVVRIANGRGGLPEYSEKHGEHRGQSQSARQFELTIEHKDDSAMLFI